MINISKHKGKTLPGARFSIIVPTWNNLEYLKLCIRSIQQNSYFQHQVIIHINEGVDGTMEWVKKLGFDHTFSAENTGICYPLNEARLLMDTDYLVYMNDDMYVCPGWDIELWKEIEKQPDNRFFFSCTMIEPYQTRNKCVIAPRNYGQSVPEFEEKRLLEEYQGLDKADWSGATWPPNIIHKDLWDLVGGYSVEFSPGFYSDPDFSMKLWQAGIRNFKGIGKSRVYHFGSKTTKKIKTNTGSKIFLKKWGITSSTFTLCYLRQGEKYKGPLSEPLMNLDLRMRIIKSYLKEILSH
jgi:glycosyltransferase involved in cell wall biosynthesis